MKTKLLAAIIAILFATSLAPVWAAKPSMKTVDTVVGSYTMDGTTVYYVSHITGLMKWIVEPTDYMEWPVGSGELIPINGEFWAKSSSSERDKLFTDDSRISITCSGSSYVGTFKVMPTPPELPWLPPYMPMPKNLIMNTHTVTKNYGELGTSRHHTVVKYRNFVPHILMEKMQSPPQPPGRTPALLTGVINNYGLDENGDSLYEYLVVSIEVHVRTSGIYNVVASGLQDSSYNWINVYNGSSLYLDRGTHFVDVWLDGRRIYLSGFNPSIIPSIDLYDEYFNSLASISEVSLSREYSFEEFERPPASLIGLIYDEGVNTDSDGTFDYLEIGVEVNVLQAGNYIIDAWGLHDTDYNNINVWDNEISYLDVGTQTVTLTFNGPTIHASGINPSFVASVNLYDEYNNFLDYRYDVPLSHEYSYTEFDTPGAYLTGIITDQGVNTDLDGTYDYLEIGVQVEVSEAGTYTVTTDGLLNEENAFIWVGNSNFAYLDVGTQFVHLQLNGPDIYMQGLNPSRVLSISLFDEDYNDLGRIEDIALSRTYLHTEFDASP